jgi:quercetin dioxygenase-like cupin family protein
MAQAIVVNVNEMPFEEVRRGRVHQIRRKRLPLDHGVPGVTIEFSYSIVPEGYFTPRHRHNFDQIRYTISGVQSTGHGDLGPGECGYFPEGAYYGPQEQKGECHTLVMQYQGASGEHLLSNDEMNDTYNRMIAAGAVFENGVYKGRKPDGGRINKDSYEAIWEEHEGRDLAFPAPRYRTPAMMPAGRYRWVPDRARPGVETKHLGTFTELRTAIGLFRMLPGATIKAGRQGDAELRYVLDGSVRYGGQTWPAGSYFFLPPGVAVEALATDEGASFFIIGLPMIAELAA